MWLINLAISLFSILKVNTLECITPAAADDELN